MLIRISTISTFLRACNRTYIPCACFRKAWKKDETFYDILGVKRTATDKEIKEAYLKLCKQYHPDSNKNDKDSHDKFIKISQAYAVLSKPEEKRLYDATLSAGLNPEPGEKFTAEDWDPKKPHYYYHPRFYKDPKMREAAAKAWEQNTGISFSSYTRPEYDHEKPINKGQGLHFALLALLLGGCVGMLAYLSGKSYVDKRRVHSFEANKRYDEQTLSDLEKRAKPSGRRIDETPQRKKDPKDVEQEKDLSLDYIATPEKPVGT